MKMMMMTIIIIIWSIVHYSVVSGHYPWFCPVQQIKQ